MSSNKVAMNLTESNNFAPGARVEIRDAEWIIRRVDVEPDLGYQLTCEGISELVRGKEAKFLTHFEDGQIHVLDPATTELVQDTSHSFQRSLLYIESHYRQAIPDDNKIHVAQHAAMDVIPYQLEPTISSLAQPRQRILIADSVGLGKTLEAGILVTELIRRGKGNRILVLTLKSMMTQFQKEFWNRFSIPLTRLDSAGLQRVRSRIPGNHNPFYYYDKTIISIDTLKQDNEFKNYLEQSHWDIIVIDEAHNVADRGTSSQRASLAKLLAKKSDSLIMLSATPHDGRAKSFASLVNMLDPTAIPDTENYINADFKGKGLVVRRFKKDIKDQVEKEFKERTVYRLDHKATEYEEAIYDALVDIPYTYKGQFDNEKQGHLIRIGLQKSLFSSPFACLASVRERIKTLQKTNESDDVLQEISGLQFLEKFLTELKIENWAKYQNFIELLKSKQFGWKKTNIKDRLVIFSERIETLKFLEKQLKKDLKLSDKQITQLHGSMSDFEQQQIVEDFGNMSSPLRVLLCSDVASEGINLHYLSHRLIHFDLPWSLMVYQQRNGRIDRYGQEHNPEIYYLLTECDNKQIQGDLRTLEILQEKEDQAHKNIGDPADIMNVHDPFEEERLVMEAMAIGKSSEEFKLDLETEESNEGDEFLSMFLEENKNQSTELQTVESFSIFKSDYHFMKACLEFINRQKNNGLIEVDYNDDTEFISLVAPSDLTDRFRFMPREIWPENGVFELTSDVKGYQKEVARSRNDTEAWPKQHYLWKGHPVTDWLQDRMMGNTGRHEALVMGLSDGINVNECYFLVSALIPNRKATPVIWEWYAVHCQNDAVTEVLSMPELINKLGFGRKVLPNTGKQVDIAWLDTLKKPVVEAVKEQVLLTREQFNAKSQPKLDKQLSELALLRKKQEQQVEIKFQQSKQQDTIKESNKIKKMKYLNDIFEDYQQWIKETMETEAEPYIQIIAVIAKTL